MPQEGGPSDQQRLPQQQQQDASAGAYPSAGYPVPYPYKYATGGANMNVTYPGGNAVGYMGETDSQQLSRRGSSVSVPYAGVLPVVYPPQQQQGYYQYPSRQQYPMFPYYPVYPPLPREGAGNSVYLEPPSSNGVLPSLQIQQPMVQQARGKQRISLPFNPPALPQQPQPLSLPNATTVPSNDTNNSNERHDYNADQGRRPLRRNHEQGYIHKCHLCNKSFKRRSWLKRHLLSHSPDRHFACPWCLSKHKRKDNLLQHMKLKHTDYVLQELKSHNINVDGGFLTISTNNNIRSLLYEGKLNKDEVKKVLNSLIDTHNRMHT